MKKFNFYSFENDIKFEPVSIELNHDLFSNNFMIDKDELEESKGFIDFNKLMKKECEEQNELLEEGCKYSLELSLDFDCEVKHKCSLSKTGFLNVERELTDIKLTDERREQITKALKEYNKNKGE